MEVELKVYLDENAESFDFNGSRYTETTTFNITMNESYPISVKLKPEKTFNVWYQYGVLFENAYSTDTMCSVTVEECANCIPNIN